MAIPNLGDTVWEITSVGESEDGLHLVKRPQKGTVCWVHPEGRYYVVQFRAFKECFLVR